MTKKTTFTPEQAKTIGERLGIRWETFDLEQFRAGLAVELEHGTVNPSTDVSHDDPLTTGRITLAHLNEFPDYYTRLAQMETEAKRRQVGPDHQRRVRCGSGTFSVSSLVRQSKTRALFQRR